MNDENGITELTAGIAHATRPMDADRLAQVHAAIGYPATVRTEAETLAVVNCKQSTRYTVQAHKGNRSIDITDFNFARIVEQLKEWAARIDLQHNRRSPHAVVLQPRHHLYRWRGLRA